MSDFIVLVNSFMLNLLSIKNFAIVDGMDMPFSSGLNIITGETGAGKTIVIGALGFVLGERASLDFVRSGAKSASVSAVFELSDAADNLISILNDAGIDIEDGELAIRRVLYATGKGQISINGIPVPLAVLRSIGRFLVDVSNQHEHQALLDAREHVKILDAFGNLHDDLKKYTEVFKRYRNAKLELDRLKMSSSDLRERLDFIRYQMNELNSANIQPDELADIEAKLPKLKHAARLNECVRSAEDILYSGSSSATENIGAAIKFLEECVSLDPSLNRLSERINRVHTELEDTAMELLRYADSIESDPAVLEFLEDRKQIIMRVISKYGGSIESCMKKAEELKGELDGIENFDDEVEEKEKAIAVFRGEMIALGKKLARARRHAAGDIVSKMEVALSELGMGKSSFSVSFEDLSEDDWNDEGPNRAEFMLSPNVGETPKRLAKIASGGELSRVMLALKDVLADRANFASTSVFDEVDSGIGGAIADVVGKKLKSISTNRQVLCITHLPQVAAYGENHIRLYKVVEDGRTKARFDTLDSKKRVDEIARMLGGSRITSKTKEHAAEILKDAIGGRI